MNPKKRRARVGKEAIEGAGHRGVRATFEGLVRRHVKDAEQGMREKGVDEGRGEIVQVVIAYVKPLKRGC